MKKVFYSAITILVIGLIIVGCNKMEKETNTINSESDKQIVPNTDVTVQMTLVDDDGDTTDLTIQEGFDYTTGQFFGLEVNQLFIGDKISSELTSMSLDNTSPVTYISVENIYVQSISFDNYDIISEEEFEVDITVNGISQTVNIKSSDFTVENFQEGILLLNSDAKNPVLYSWYALKICELISDVVITVSNNCKDIVITGINGCVSQGKCYTASACSVSCFSCE